MHKIHVWPQQPAEREAWVRLSAWVERAGEVSKELWFEVAGEWKSCICASADAFAIATFFLAAKERAELHVHGTVSPTLLRNLEEISLMWSLWKPGQYAPISLAADFESEAIPSHPQDTISCFSGGVDGAFTAYRHHQGLCGRQRRHLTAGLLVQGFDIALDQPEQFACAAIGAGKSLQSLELPLVRMRTNLRELGVEWVTGFGAAMAASLSILKGHFGAGLIGSDERYDFVGAARLHASGRSPVLHGRISRGARWRGILQDPKGPGDQRVGDRGGESPRLLGRQPARRQLRALRKVHPDNHEFPGRGRRPARLFRLRRD